MSYLVVEASIQAVQLVLGFPPLVSLALLHLWKTLIDPTHKTSVIELFPTNWCKNGQIWISAGEAQEGKYGILKLCSSLNT